MQTSVGKKNPSCSISLIIVSLKLHMTNVPMIRCFLIPSSSFLNNTCEMRHYSLEIDP
jgi:hypothetical protein